MFKYAVRFILSFFLAQIGTALFAQTSDLVSRSSFRVCADPANSPQSMEDGSGYENKIAEIMADALGLEVEYYWFPMSTGFIRNSLAAFKCDVVIGYSAGHELVLNTNPYLTSTYVLIAKPDSAYADVRALKDARLDGARIGLIAGGAPGTHLAKYHRMGQVAPYALFVDRRRESPAQDMLADLESGEIDIAILWGPIGAPLAKSDYPDFIVTPLLEEEGKPVLFARITMGVRQGEIDWKRELNSQIRRNQDAIDAVLREYGVPLLLEQGDALKEEK